MLSQAVCILLRACCQLRNECCHLTVKPAQLFQLGSNLTVYCDYKECQPRYGVFFFFFPNLWSRRPAFTSVENIVQFQGAVDAEFQGPGTEFQLQHDVPLGQCAAT